MSNLLQQSIAKGKSFLHLGTSSTPAAEASATPSTAMSLTASSSSGSSTGIFLGIIALLAVAVVFTFKRATHPSKGKW